MKKCFLIFGIALLVALAFVCLPIGNQAAAGPGVSIVSLPPSDVNWLVDEPNCHDYHTDAMQNSVQLSQPGCLYLIVERQDGRLAVEVTGPGGETLLDEKNLDSTVLCIKAPTAGDYSVTVNARDFAGSYRIGHL